MKINLLLVITFLSIIVYAGIDYSNGIVGLTKRDGGLGCICHSFSPTSSVQVWIEGPDSVIINNTVQYKLLMTGGPAVAGGFNVATYYGELDSVDALTQVMFGELTHTEPNPFQNDTVFWDFLYTAPNNLLTDTIYSVANSVNWDSIPSNLDQWNFGNNFVVHVIDNPVPVELSNFAATSNFNNVQISWTTITETNNYGFDIERKTEASNWMKITFIPGFGTSTEIHNYTYNDNNLEVGNYLYRLKQIDLDGNYSYSEILNVNVNIPEHFTLEQNFPNPFNPITKIRFVIASGAKQSQLVTLKVFDVVGNEIATLLNGELSAGEYEVEFNASTLTSGIYLYKLETGDPSTSTGQNISQTKKMVLLK